MSKDLFSLMREQEIATSNFLPTKKEIKKTSEQFAISLANSGEHNLQQLFSQALRFSESTAVIMAKLKSYLPDEDFEAYGLKGQYRSGGKTINYKDDPIWLQLKKDLTDREELLKLAQHQPVIDGYGNDVPKVSTTERKSSLAITY
jgi:hypothetical protein